MVALAVNRLSVSNGPLPPVDEALVARLTQAAYDVALRHSPTQPFTDLQLTLWRELRAVFQAQGHDIRERP